MHIRIYHNVSQDEQGRPEGFWGHKPEHPVTPVFEYDAEHPSDEAACEAAFYTFNVGEDSLALAYRERRLRSLSVGDVVAVDDRFYAVASLGFTQVTEPVVRAETRHGTVPLDLS